MEYKMFNFLSMVDNYDDRKVDRYEEGDLIVDTCSVTDGDHTYETGVCHPKYNNGRWVIVEAYDTKEEAQAGHDKWVSKMTAKELPAVLVDCNNAMLGQLASAFGADTEFPLEA